ncbi:MAG: PAS domain S-box protein [Verrucomicrobia bacterium]|nr:PAS domain S-box protein [Verrucomicrobiota bacterium]
MAAYAIVLSGVIATADGRIARYLSHLNDDLFRAGLFVAVTTLVLYVGLHWLAKHFDAADAAIRASEERWKFALDGAGDGTWDWDGPTKKVFYSPRWKHILGYGVDEVGDRLQEWFGRIHPQDAPRVREQLRLHYLRKIPTFQCEHRLRTKDGSYKWVSSQGQIMRRHPNGRPQRAIGTLTDISERKESEARIAGALNFTHAILYSAPVGIVTYRASGETVSANDAAAQFAGCDVEDLVKQNFRELASWRRHGLVELAERALRENKTVFHATQFTTLSGRDTWCELRFAPFVYDGEQRLLLILQETTEQRAAIERLELLHAAVAAAPTAWIVTDARGVIEWVNPAFTTLTGYSAAEVSGRTLSLLKSGRHPASFYANLWRTIADGRIWQGEMCNRHKSGALYHERMTIAPVRDHDGKIAHYVAMKENITDQRQLEAQLARSQRLESIGLLASGIAHDLNNMLAPIMLAVSLIKDRHRDRETLELLDMMQGAAQRGGGVVQQVLTFARGADGARVQIDVRPLVKELAQLVRETFPRQIRVTVAVPPSPLLVQGDVTQLHQVLLNLAVNARDAMPDGGTLTLKAETVELDALSATQAPSGKPGSYVKIGIVDTGSGIPPEVMEHIFEPFFTTKPRGEGTGLGLSTVYGIVRGHGGFVTVNSTPGMGTEFDVMLPVCTEQKTPAQPLSSLDAPRISGGGRRVLVVDDEAPVRLVTSKMLNRLGFIAVAAEDGQKGLDRIREQPDGYSVAIVDLMMPGMNGYRLIGELKTLAPSMPIIVASGMMGDKEGEGGRAMLLTLGVRTVLAKPFAEKAFIDALDAELGAAVRTGPVRIPSDRAPRYGTS